jgi:hypothetical protein
MVNSRRPKADLGDFKTFAFLAKQVRSGYPTLSKASSPIGAT